MNKIFQIIILYVYLCGANKYNDNQLIMKRVKRTLIFPPTAPTRAQLIYGIGVPLNLHTQSVTTGYVLKAQYFLPTNVTMLRTMLPLPLTFANNGKKRSLILSNDTTGAILIDELTGQKYERYEEEAILIDKNDKHVDEEDSEEGYWDYNFLDSEQRDNDVYTKARWDVYLAIESLINRSLKNNAQFSDKRRVHRSLIFPPTAPTRIQLIYGIGIPLDIQVQAVTTGYVLKAQYFIPTKATEIRADLIPPTYLNKRSIISNNDSMLNVNMIDEITGQKYEKYDVEAVLIDSGNEEDEYEKDEDLENMGNHKEWVPTARWAIYNAIENLVNRLGLDGKACMLRSICESAEAPFHYRTGILGELLHIVMTPSTSVDKIESHIHNEYCQAEIMGKMGVPCERVFKECDRSLLDEFSGIYHHSGMELKNLFSF